ncbi:MAG: hypothetical protein QXG86_00335 [Candidatus Woesearchaeota archaeon]
MVKKAQGMSLNVVIIAALGLLVLVVLSIIFTGRTGIFVRESDKCTTKYGNAGRCVAVETDCNGAYDKISWGACDLNGDGKFNFNNKDSDGFCCVTVGAGGVE